MRKLLLFVVCIGLATAVSGQFRGTKWGMSINEVTVKENVGPADANVFDFRNGNKSLGFKSTLDLGEINDLVYSNYHFINDKLRSGSYVFYELDLDKVDKVIDQVSTSYGRYDVYYGNQKLKRTIKAKSSMDYRKYLEENQSLEIIWEGNKSTKVVLRIITTGTDLFGTWGWLSFYEDDYFKKTIEPSVIRSMTGEE